MANTGLHQQHGIVNVLPYEDGNPLYRRGFLKVSDNRRYLTYGDGTPFLWIGDTAWAVPQRANDEEWEAYVADRTAKHFTLLQVPPAPKWAGENDRQGERPFTDQACGRWNSAYWQFFERKIQRANERGLTVLLVGLMEPVHRYPEPAHARLFARNIIAPGRIGTLTLEPRAAKDSTIRRWMTTSCSPPAIESTLDIAPSIRCAPVSWFPWCKNSGRSSRAR